MRAMSSARALAASSRTAWSPNSASSSFCATTAEPPAMPTSAPEIPIVWLNTTSMSTTPTPFTPKDSTRAVVRRSFPCLLYTSRCV